MSGETTTSTENAMVTFRETDAAKGTWTILNDAISSFRSTFGVDKEGLVVAAFRGDEEAHKKCIDEIDFFEACFSHEHMEELMTEEEEEFIEAAIRIFTDFMELATGKAGRRLATKDIEAYTSVYASALFYSWLAMCEEGDYISMDDDQLEGLYYTLKTLMEAFADVDYAINMILAGYCTSLDYDDSDIFFNMVKSITEILECECEIKTEKPVSEITNTKEDSFEEPDEDTAEAEEEHIGTVLDDFRDILRGYGSFSFVNADEKLKVCLDGLCTEIVTHMFYAPTNTKDLGFEQWLSTQLIGVCQELYMLGNNGNETLLRELCAMIADILDLLVKAEYYPNIPQRKYHLPEFNVHAVSKREILKLKDTSIYVLNHMIYELDEACRIEVAKAKGSCFIHISEFAHYGLTCALRIEKAFERRDTVKDLKEVANTLKDVAEIEGKPIITAQQNKRSRKPEYDPKEDPEWDPSWDDDEDDEDLADFSFEEAHDQLEMYAKIRKNREEMDINEMEDWLMRCHVSNIEKYNASEALKDSIDTLKSSAHKQLDIIKGFGARMRDEIVRVTPDEATKTRLKEVGKMLKDSSKGRKK